MKKFFEESHTIPPCQHFVLYNSEISLECPSISWLIFRSWSGCFCRLSCYLRDQPFPWHLWRNESRYRSYPFIKGPPLLATRDFVSFLLSQKQKNYFRGNRSSSHELTDCQCFTNGTFSLYMQPGRLPYQIFSDRLRRRKENPPYLPFD